MVIRTVLDKHKYYRKSGSEQRISVSWSFAEQTSQKRLDLSQTLTVFLEIKDKQGRILHAYGIGGPEL